MKYEVIAVDFDGTIHDGTFHRIGNLVKESKEVIKRFRAGGGKVILWTCRSSRSDLIPALEFLLTHDIEVDEVNRNTPERMAMMGEQDTRKPWADMYIDDLNSGGIDWDEIKRKLFGEGS